MSAAGDPYEEQLDFEDDFQDADDELEQGSDQAEEAPASDAGPSGLPAPMDADGGPAAGQQNPPANQPAAGQQQPQPVGNPAA